MLRIMRLFKTLLGTNLSSDQEQAIKSLEATLPDGWKLVELRRQLVGRRPVKHETFGAVVKGPERTVVAVALDGVRAVQAVASAVQGSATTSRQWAPPPILPSSPDFSSAVAALDRVTRGGRRPRGNAEDSPRWSGPVARRRSKRFGGLTIVGVTAHMPDQTGIAGFGLDPTSAFCALAARLQGELPVTDVWFPET